MIHEDYSALHSTYCTCTNRTMPMSSSMHFAWAAWSIHGWTEADIKLVVAHINKLIKLNRRRPESLRFHNLIGDTERFLEDISEARALSRQPKPTPRTEILRATGRPEPVQDTARSAAQIIAAEKAFEQFRQLKETL